jgi:hypothetical protein
VQALLESAAQAPGGTRVHLVCVKRKADGGVQCELLLTLAYTKEGGLAMGVSDKGHLAVLLRS